MKKTLITILIIILVISISVFGFACKKEGPVEKSAKKEINLDDFSAENIITDGVVSPDEYPFSYEDHETGIIMYWFNDSSDLYVCLESPSGGWTAVGFDPGFAMNGANIIFFTMDGESVLVRDDFGVSSFSHDDDETLGGSFDITKYAGKNMGDGATFEFVLPLKSGDEFDKVLEQGNDYQVILAINSKVTNFDTKHTNKSSTTITLN